jgi:hypothetical protein
MPALRIRFDGVIAYRSVGESYRLRRSAPAMGAENPLPTLLTVEDSDFVRWLVDEARGVLEASDLTHYAIYNLDDCIDVVARLPPIVDWPNATRRL